VNGVGRACQDHRVRTITDDQRRARIARRHALAPAARVDGVADAVATMTCLHATEPANVYLSAFSRADVSRKEIDVALYDDRSVVRQLAMRRTVFAFPRELVPAVLGSASARVAAQLSARLAKEVAANGLADDGVAWVRRTCEAVLAEVRREPATTMQLRERVPGLALRLQMSPGKSYGGEFPIAPRVLSTLAAGGAVVRGRNDAGWKVSRPFWPAAEDWFAGPVERAAEADGYAALVGRWLGTFGPGTEDDIVWWLGATKAAVRRALATVEAEQVALEDGTTGWVLPDDTDAEEPGPWAALLPALDPTTMGWKERGFYLGEHAERLFDRNGNGGPSAWWDGRIVGGWRQEDDGRVVVVPAEDLGKAATAALAREADRLTGWLDGEVVRSIYQSPLARQAESSSSR
jgi:hypothetical protein